MGMQYRTYVVYGVFIPSDRLRDDVWFEVERLDGLIKSLGDKASGVGHLFTHGRDDDGSFLCCGGSVQVESGRFLKVPVSLDIAADWDAKIAAVAEAAGYGDLGEPAWLVVPAEF